MKSDIVNRTKKMTLEAYQLDIPYQNHRILRAGINLYLAQRFRGERRNSVFPGRTEGGSLTLRNCGITLNIEQLTTHFAAIQRCDIGALPFELQQICKRADMKHANEVMVRLAGLCNPIRTGRTTVKTFSERMPPDEQSKVLEEYDRQTTYQLAPYFGLDDSPVSRLQLQELTGIHPFWMYCFTNEENCITTFRNACGGVVYYVVRKKLRGHHVELPITNFICGGGDEFPVYRMPNLENGGMFPLYAVDKLEIFPETPVILTDILEIASEFNLASEDLIVTGFYGGIDAIPLTDVRPLFGAQRKTYWLLQNRPGCKDPASTYRAGLKMLERFRSYDRNLYFLEPTEPRWRSIRKVTGEPVFSCKSDFREVEFNQFMQRCRKLKIRVVDAFCDDEPEILSGSAANLVEDDVPFITPIAKKGGFVIIYATAKAGKTFFALHLALSMAYGKDPIPEYWLNAAGKPKKVLYVSGEMTKAQFKKRKLREEAFLNPDASLLDNIAFLHARGRYLDKPEDQKYFDLAINKEAPDMIILDNLQSLSSSGGATRNAFHDLFLWLGHWLDLGIQVTLINHTNKKGEIIGSGEQSGDCDTMIRLYRASKDDTIRILIAPEDFRDGKRSSFHPILASYDFDDEANSGWRFEPRDAEFAKKIAKWNEDGCTESAYPES